MLLSAVLLWHVSVGYAEQIGLEQVLEDARLHAVDLRIAEYDLLAATAQVAESRSDYYPQLSLRIGNEYVRVHGADNNVVSVGDAILADSASGYKHSLIFSAQYTLYDFGRRALNLEYAKGRQQLAGYQREKTWRHIRLQLVDLYTLALKQQKKLVAQRYRNLAAQQVYRFSERLWRAGRYGRDTVALAALELAAAGIDVQDLDTEFANTLDSLAYFTGRSYPVETTTLAELPIVANVDGESFDLEHHPDILLVQQEIAQKEIELRLTQCSRYPQLVLSGSHRMFGSDRHHFGDSLSSLTTRDSRIVLYVEAPLFAGFRSLARATRLQHELKALQLRKQKIATEITAEIRQRQRLYRNLSQQEVARIEQQNLIDRQLHDLARMTEQQLLDQIAACRKNIEMSQQQLEVDLRRVDLAAQSCLLRYMSEGE